MSQPTDTSRNTKDARAPCGQGRNTDDGYVAIFSKIPAMVLRSTSVLRNSKQCLFLLMQSEDDSIQTDIVKGRWRLTVFPSVSALFFTPIPHPPPRFPRTKRICSVTQPSFLCLHLFYSPPAPHTPPLPKAK